MNLDKNGCKNAVVFGGSGFLGSYVVTELAEKDGECVLLILFHLLKKWNLKIMFIDLNDNDSMVEAISEDTSVVYNFAGMSDLDEALNQPLLTMELNIMEISEFLKLVGNKELDILSMPVVLMHAAKVGHFMVSVNCLQRKLKNKPVMG